MLGIKTCFSSFLGTIPFLPVNITFVNSIWICAPCLVIHGLDLEFTKDK